MGSITPTSGDALISDFTYAKSFSEMPGCGASEVFEGSFKFSRSCFFKASSGIRDLGRSAASLGSSPPLITDQLTKSCRGPTVTWAEVHLLRFLHCRTPGSPGIMAGFVIRDSASGGGLGFPILMGLKKPLSELGSFTNTKSPGKATAMKTVPSAQDFTNRWLEKNLENPRVPKEVGFV